MKTNDVVVTPDTVLILPAPEVDKTKEVETLVEEKVEVKQPEPVKLKYEVIIWNNIAKISK